MAIILPASCNHVLNIELPIRFSGFFLWLDVKLVYAMLRTRCAFFQNGVKNSVWYTHFIEKEKKKERAKS